jgi:hypothetical protein
MTSRAAAALGLVAALAAPATAAAAPRVWIEDVVDGQQFGRHGAC